MRSKTIIAFLGIGLLLLLIHSFAEAQFRSKRGGMSPGGGGGPSPFGGGSPSPFGGGGGPSPFGGGFSPFGGGGPRDPNMIFDFLSRGRGFILPTDSRSMGTQLAEWVKEKGIANGQISREEFQTFFKERMQNMAPPGGGPPGMRPPFGPPGGSGSPGTTPSPGGPGSPPGSEDLKERMNQWIESRFKERDRNGDGFLNFDEMNDSLRRDLARWDTNKDGLIDLNEYKAYSAERMQQRERGGDSQPAENPVVTIILEEEQDRRPTIFRAGKLPKELPSWFEQLDTDKDGQVALYEWRQAGRELEEFQKYDRNDDGFLTAEEVLRKQNPTQTAANGTTPPGAGPALANNFNNMGNGPGPGFGPPGGFGGQGPGRGFFGGMFGGMFGGKGGNQGGFKGFRR